MKKIIYFILFSVLLSLSSCVEEEKDKFDDTAANRMSKLLKEYKELLESSPNGWVMAYYYESDPSIKGGVLRLCSFKNGIITAAAEETISIPPTENSDPKTYKPGETSSSQYDLISNQGPVLTIDTYNDIMHFLALPYGNDVDGQAGDYEFTFMSVEANKIVFKGKKHGKRIVMTRMPENITWDQYLAQIHNTTKNAESLYAFDMIINNQTVGYAIFDKSQRQFSFEYETGQGTEIITSHLSYTPTGIILYEPITFGETTVENFNLNISDSLYVSSDGAGMTLKKVRPLGFRYYQQYIGDYSAKFVNFAKDTVELNVKISPLVDKSTYRLTGLSSSYNFVLQYEDGPGRISLYPQNLSGPSGSFTRVDLYGWNGASSLWPYLDGTIIYEGTANREETLKTITFTMTGTQGGSFPGLIIIGTSGGGYSIVGGNNGAFKNLVLTKK